jgi:serine/threonine protein kinase
VSLAPGTQLGAYKVTARIGAGAMGEVYRARDTLLNRDVAIKVLPDSLVADATRRARFEREARMLAALNHSHIAAIYGFETSDPEKPALVLELVEGPTLADRLAGVALSPRVALEFAIQIADALDAAHSRGIVHRDLKPANIKVADAGQVKVLDFGLAKVITPDAAGGGEDERATALTVAETRRGEIVGTPAYMSPEQARGEPVDKRTDIWAFGCVLYEMLAGRSPFAADTVSDVIVRILDREPDWARLPTSTSPLVRRILQRCLEKNVARRLHDIADARLDLEDALSNKDAPSRDRPRTGRHAIWDVGGAAAIALIVWLAIALWPRATPPASVSVKIAVPSGSATADPGRLLGPPLVSPDGSTVVVSLNTGKQRGLFVRRLDSDNLKPLEGTTDAAYPFWSPDSQTIAFFADGKLKTIAAAGGTTVTLCSAPEQRGGAWSEQGTIIFGLNARGIFRCDRETSELVEITSLDTSLGENSHRYPVFLPDGNRFLYYARTNDLEKRAVYLDTLDRSTPRKRVLVADGQFAIGRDPRSSEYYLLSQQAGQIFAQRLDMATGTVSGESLALLDRAGQVSVSNTGTLVMRPEAQDRSRLVWFDRTGRETGAIGTPTDYWQVALSPDNTRIAVVKHDYLSGSFAVWMAPANDGQLEPVSSSNRALDPTWSPDSKAIYYSVGRQILRRTLEPKGAEEQVGESTTAYRIRDVSSRIGVIAAEKWERGNSTRVSAHWRPLAGGEWMPFGGEGSHEQPRFSPNGKWLAYTSNRSGSDEIYVTAFPNGSTYRLSRSGGREPHWRGDGAELFFLGLDQSIFSVDVSQGFDAAPPVPLFRAAVRRGSEGPLFDVTRDGQRFIVIAGESVESPDSIDVVLNWPSLIRR